MLLPIIYYGNPILRKRCEEVTEITPEIIQLVQDMVETMDKNNGIGLAAPQVGRCIRLFVLRNYIFEEDGKVSLSDSKVYINPKLTSPSVEKITEAEGCLSIPGINEEVDRPARITVEAMDINGQIFVEELEGINARVRMHENDHINGVLFIDRVPADVRKRLEPILQNVKKKYN